MKRPLPVIVFGCLFILAGAVGLLYHLKDRPLDREFFMISGVRLLAIIGGAFLLLGHNWSRWLLMLWLGFHVVISAFHSLQEFAAHLVILFLYVYFIFRPPASAYFRVSDQKQHPKN
ncbi:MAG TPA: hypothetical protein VEU98_07910 [Candidatus Eremiobacteraceae bacterium]|nr:hypothetical protein [Candidatus Eremiobacteraceae bacterium]